MAERQVLRILFPYSPVEDYTRLRDLILQLPDHYVVDVRINSPELTAKLRNIEFDLLILFTSVKEISELGWIKNFSSEFPQKPIVVISPREDLDFASQMIQWGVQDYHVLDEISTQDLIRSFNFAVERSHMIVDLGKHVQERFQQLIERNFDAMVIADPAGVIQYINPAAAKLFDTDNNSMIGKNFRYPIKPKEITEIEVPRKDGRTFQGELRILPIDWNQKECHLAVIRDLTNFTSLEKLKTELNEYERLSKLKDQFIGTVSHELRTPLTIIRGAVGNLKDGIVGDLTETQLKVIKIANNNVDRLARMIDNLLDLSRLESERVHINPRQIELERFIQNVSQNFQILASEKNLNLSFKVPSGIASLFADPDMIGQVMNNLISNAIRYAKSKIHVSAKEVVEEDETWLQVSVKDDGPGIPESQFEDLFSKFVQHNRPKGGAGYKGTGLGLAISKAIIEQHQGKIWIESTIDKGSTFHFKLTHYNESKIFNATVNESIKECELMSTSLCILVIFINNINELHKSFNGPEINRMFEDIEGQLRNKVLRQSDKVTFFTDRGLLLIQVTADHKAGLLVKESIPELTQNILCDGAEGKKKPQLQVGMAMYPDSGNDPQILLNQAYQSSVIKKVMLIDNPQNLLYIMAMLRKTKVYNVEIAIDEESGIDLARSHQPDVLLINLDLPGMDVWGFCQKIRALPNTKDVPIIIMTSQKGSLIQDDLKLVSAEMINCPYDKDEFLQQVQEAALGSETVFKF